MHIKGVYEVSIFGNDNVAVARRKLVDDGVRRAVAERQIKRVDRFVSCLSQPRNEPTRELSIDQKLHADIGSRRLIWLNRVANESAARISSRSKSS